MTPNSQSSSQSSKEIVDELQALIAEAEKMLTDSAAEKTSETVSALRARFDAVQERLNAAYADSKQKVADGAKYADEAIRSNPYQAVAIAAGVGALVGVLIGRRFGK